MKPEKHPYDGTNIVRKKGCPNCHSEGKGLVLMRSSNKAISLYLCMLCHWTGHPFKTKEEDFKNDL